MMDNDNDVLRELKAREVRLMAELSGVRHAIGAYERDAAHDMLRDAGILKGCRVKFGTCSVEFIYEGIQYFHAAMWHIHLRKVLKSGKLSKGVNRYPVDVASCLELVGE